MRSSSPLLAALILLFAAGCGGEPGGAAAGASATSGTASAGSGGGGGGLPSTEPFEVKFGPVVVPPGTENTQCVVKRLGNVEPVRVGTIQNELTDASHHLIVYRTNDAEERPEPFDCTPFKDTLDPTKGAPIMVTQKHEETLELPPGVAFPFESGQMVRLEMHYLNAGTEPRAVEARSLFYPIPDEAFEHEAGFLFVGTVDIEIPPNSKHTVGPAFFPLPEDLAASSFFGVTGHTHQWGTDVSVAASTSELDPGTPIYDVENWTWSEPETVTHDPPVVVPEGGGFRFSCSWDNKSSKTVRFGESAEDEMCFFWTYYYPAKSARVCFHTEQLGGFDACCPGHPACDQLL